MPGARSPYAATHSRFNPILIGYFARFHWVKRAQKPKGGSSHLPFTKWKIRSCRNHTAAFVTQHFSQLPEDL